MKGVILFLLILYKKFISPFKPGTCRFYPSCSTYMYQAIQKYGVIKGLTFGIKRILKCNPFHEGGYDPIPEK